MGVQTLSPLCRGDRGTAAVGGQATDPIRAAPGGLRDLFPQSTLSVFATDHRVDRAIDRYHLNEGWIKTCHARLSAWLASFLLAVTAALRAAKAVCCDETCYRFLGRRFWLHVCCTGTLALLGCNWRRGTDGIDALVSG
ncbi:MAG: hypothetical protein EXS40_08130 [Opitutaceae bacterium]|nr:hypothetical protein [Opitutaceae bacterium]